MQFIRSKTGITIVVLIAVFVFLYFFSGVFGSTFLGITLKTNPDLENGLVAHYTFDNKNMDLSSTTAEVLDRGSGGNNGDMVNFVNSFSGAEAESLSNASTSIIRESCSGYSRCYTSLASWETANQGDITEAGTNVVAIARIEGTWSSADTTMPDFTSGWTVDEDNYIVIYTTDEAHHGGYWNTNAYRLEVTTDGADSTVFDLPNHSHIEGVQVGITAGYGWPTAIAVLDGGRIIGNLIRGVGGLETYGNGAGIVVNPSSGINSYIINNIVYAYISGSGDQNNAISVGGVTNEYNVIVYNNTVASSSHAFSSAWNTSILKNNLCFENDGNCYTAENWGTPGHTANAGPTTTFPTGDWVDITGESSADLFVDYTNRDLRLKVGSFLIATGTSLSRDAYFPFNYDIEYQARGVSWDVGADQFDGAQKFGGVGGVTQGVLGQGMEFDGADDYVDLGDFNDIDASDFTVAAWINVDDYTADQGAIISKRDSGTQGFVVRVETDGSIGAWSNSPNDDKKQTSANLISVNTWHHVTVVYDDSPLDIDIYVDGVLVPNSQEDDTIITGHVEQGTPFLLGRRDETAVFDNFDGSIDDVRIYDRALSASEITRLYGLGATTKIAKTIDTNPDLENGLVGHWTFDGAEVWTQVTDQSGNGNTGYLNANMPTTTAVVTGVIGQAFDFDGTDDWVNVGSDASLDNLNTASTFATWVYPESYDTSSGFTVRLINKTQGSNGKIFGFSNSSGYLSCEIDTDSTGAYSTIYDAVAPLNTWSHVACVHVDGSAPTIYVNGVEVTPDGSSAGTGNYIDESADDMHIGARGGDGLRRFDGKMDDVRVYNRALSTDEIMRLYQLGATTKIGTTIDTNPDLKDGLVGHWTFDGMDMDLASNTAEVLDVSGNSNNGNWIDHATNTQPGFIGQGLSFDGVDDRLDVGNWNVNGDGITLSAWAYIDTAPSEARIISKSNSTDGVGNHDWTIIMPSSRSPRFRLITDDGAEEDILDSYVWPMKEWHHLTVTYASSTSQVLWYIDGEYKESDTRTNGGAVITGSSEPIGIGNQASGAGDRPFPGILDDVRVYERPLGADEIMRLYQLGN